MLSRPLPPWSCHHASAAPAALLRHRAAPPAAVPLPLHMGAASSSSAGPPPAAPLARAVPPKGAAISGILGASLLCSAASLRAGTLGARQQRRLQRGRKVWKVAAAATDDEVDAQDAQLAESLAQRTLEALDFDFVIQKLRGNCYTKMAQEMCGNYANLMANTAEEARELYREVQELTLLEDDDVSLAEPLDIVGPIEEAKRGAVLEQPQLAQVARAIELMLKMRTGLVNASERGVAIPHLLDISGEMDLPEEILDALLGSFDEAGELSDKKYPEIVLMRRRIEEIEREGLAKMREILSSGRYRKMMADDGYVQYGGTLTLAIKASEIGKVGGNVIDESRSGKMVYVEPPELAGNGAELKATQTELKFKIRRILGQMSLAITHAAEPMMVCLKACARIDLARARLFLGEDMEGDIPEVGEEGVIVARRARNPCLLLRRGNRVVGYRLELGTWCQGLILSGPNAGGKTVVLKTLGLFALLARCGIPVPAGENARVDFFSIVLAEVGDMQTIVDDLSTYSAHLVAARIILRQTRDAGVGALVMMDEAGTGTDPQQGAAIARATMETLLDYGTRLVATTHSLALKNWGMEDARTDVSAMEYKEGKPTFRLVRNAIGESHAIETARRLRLPQALVDRAESLLGEDQRSLLALQRRAEDLERELVEKVRRAEEREVKAREVELKARTQSEECAAKQEHLSTVERGLVMRQERMHEQFEMETKALRQVQVAKLNKIVQELKSASNGEQSCFKVVGDSIEDLKLEKDFDAVAKLKKKRESEALPGALSANEPLNMGEWVMVLASSPWYGFKGSVSRVIPGTGGQAARVSVSLQGASRIEEFKQTELGKTISPRQAETLAAKEAAKPKKHRDLSKWAF
mmetsp:Transcript_100958/g.324087  ORF Transcript_100958/g.324087 Transcript_100958/m.324087 type:complete len:870 (+) Transcript_100958:51-2660(+)